MKPFCEFSNSSQTRDGKYPRCKVCDSLAGKKWNKDNRDRARISQQQRNLKHKYGLTETQYQDLLHRQNYECAICGGTNGTKRLAVDHNHRTGHVRGLLCNTCNRALGLLGDTAENISKALSYVVKN